MGLGGLRGAASTAGAFGACLRGATGAPETFRERRSRQDPLTNGVGSFGAPGHSVGEVGRPVAPKLGIPVPKFILEGYLVL